MSRCATMSTVLLSSHVRCCAVCLDGLIDRRLQLPRMTDLLRFSGAYSLGSFAAAARELGVTRAAMGQSIGRLEQLVGEPLFRRARHAQEVSLPTAAASRIYPAAAGIVSTAAMIVGDG